MKLAQTPFSQSLLINCVPVREQRTAKLTLNSVSDILKLIPLFTVSSQKVTLSNLVIKKRSTLLLRQTFVKNIPFFYKNSIFPTLNDDSAAHCPARKRYPFSSFFCSRIGTPLTCKRPHWGTNELANHTLLNLISGCL